MDIHLGTLRYHFKEDVSTAFGLALVVLPLSLGISIASGAPPMAGVWSAIVGGLVASFVRGSHITINGPSAGLIAIMFSGISILGEGDLLFGFQCFLAATIIAGALQMLMGLFRMGEIGDMIPVAAIHGMLAAVGVIIFSMQIHGVLGVSVETENAWDAIKAIPNSIQHANPFVLIISLVTVVILLLHNNIKNKFIATVPSPVWILMAVVPLAYVFNFLEPNQLSFLGKEYEVGPAYLVNIPSNIYHSFNTPIFTKITTPSFWAVVLGITVVSTIETLVSAKVVDKLDPLNRQTNLNKELFAAGLSTSISGMIGGLPVITAIPVYSGAKTKWANLYYGIFLLVFVLLGAFIIQKTPLAALGVLLLYTAYKFAAPKILVETYRKGDDQFMIFMVTLVVSLSQGLLWGVFSGVLTTLFIHYVKSNLTPKQFFKYMLEPSIDTHKTENAHELYIKLKGVINFINIPKLKRTLSLAANEKYIVLDMSHTRLIDYTVLEYLHEDIERYNPNQLRLDITGLETHDASSRHPNATRILPEDKKPLLNKRQQALTELSAEYSGAFWPEIRWELNQFKDFLFFKSRKIEYSLNTAKGNYKLFFEWETCDITFEDGGLFSKERHTSVALLHLPFNAPVFVLQREELMDKIGVRLNLKEEDINFENYLDFSDQYLLQGPDKEEIRQFFNAELIAYLQDNPHYHIESNGAMILIFKEMRFASPSGMEQMHLFSQGLAGILMTSWKNQNTGLDTLLV